MHSRILNIGKQKISNGDALTSLVLPLIKSKRKKTYRMDNYLTDEYGEIASGRYVGHRNRMVGAFGYCEEDRNYSDICIQKETG